MEEAAGIFLGLFPPIEGWHPRLKAAGVVLHVMYLFIYGSYIYMIYNEHLGKGDICEASALLFQEFGISRLWVFQD